jgi:hypothetical protein
MDYEPLPTVKKYTLDAKFKESMDGGQSADGKPQEGSVKDLHNKLDFIKQKI